MRITESESPAYFGGVSDPYPLEAWDAEPPPGRILEVGAGSGGGTLQLARHFPGSTITCLEPGETPRAVLAWRLADRGELRERISVLPMRLQDAGELPTYDLVVAHHVICQVPGEEQAAFWTGLAGRLERSGVGLIDDHFGPTSSDSVQRRLAAEGSSGAYRVTRWFSAERLDAERRSVVNEYVVEDATGAVLHHDRNVAEQRVVDREESLRLPALCGLDVSHAATGWLRVVRSRV